MKIVHFSDLHLSHDSYNQGIVVQAFLESIEQKRRDVGAIDLAIFSGDLVFSGAEKQEFTSANSGILSQVCSALEIDRSRVILCPGNHDIDRSVVRRDKWAESGLLASLQGRDDINGFIDNYWDFDLRSAIIPDPFLRLRNFYDNVWLTPDLELDFVNLFVAVRRLQVQGISIGICAFNTAWRCTGEADNADRGNLVLGERAVDRAFSMIEDCEIKLAVFHHPTDWLREEDRSAVELRLHSKFDLFFFGHVHQNMPQKRSDLSGGAVYSQAGCLYHSRNYYNGWSLVDVDTQRSTVQFTLLEYSDQRRSFVPAERLVAGGQVSYDLLLNGQSKNSNLSFVVAGVRAGIRKVANDHIRLAADQDKAVDIDTHFVCPPLKRGSHGIYLDQLDDEQDTNVELADILQGKDNFAVVGRAESGKTTLAHFLSVGVANGTADQLRLPLYGNFAEIRKGTDSLWRSVRSFANEISDGKINKGMLASLPLFIIIDDMDFRDQERIKLLEKYMQSLPNARWCLLASEAGSSDEDRDSGSPLSQLSVYEIEPLSRKAIRQLSANWVDRPTDDDETDRVFLNVMEHIQRTGLPRSGYVVSLILWTLHNRSASELINEAVLLENIIDYLLDKMDYQGALRREFDFQSKVAVLQHLSVLFKDGGDIQDANKVVGWVIDYLNKKGLAYDAGKVADGLIDCGILMRLDDKISFRHTRFRDFFLAGYLRENNDRKMKEIQVGDNWLRYMRELDLYSARFRHESSLLDFGLEKVQESATPLDFKNEEFDAYVHTAGSSRFAKARLKAMRKEPLTASKIDEMRDKADRRLATKARKRSGESAAAKTTKSLNRSIAAVEMYSQFIRNLEFADRSEKERHLKSCLESWSNITLQFYYVVREVFTELRDEKFVVNGASGQEEIQISADIESFLKAMVPTIVSTLACGVLGTEKLAELIDEIAGNEQEEVLTRLIAAFVLLEVDPARGYRRMNSPEWTKAMGSTWVVEATEGRLFKQYLERPLPQKLKADFERLVAQIESRLSGYKSKGMTGRVMQSLSKQALQRKVVDKH